MNPPQRTVVDDVTAAAAELVASEMRGAAQRDRFVLNLSGGTTPLALLRLLALRPELPWRTVWVVWGDERFVAADHPDSNQRAARDALLDRVPIPAAQIFPWPTHERTPERATSRYAATLERHFASPPRFDLTLLGLGSDGHTASLFPGTGAATASGVTTVVRPVGEALVRLSMTATTLSSSRTIAFLVTGEAKRNALEATLSGTDQVDRFPARAIRATERLLWLTDMTPSVPGSFGAG